MEWYPHLAYANFFSSLGQWTRCMNQFDRLHFRKWFLPKWPKAPVRLIMRSLNWNEDRTNSQSTAYVCKWHIEAPPMAMGYNRDITHAVTLLWSCVARQVRALSLLFCPKRCQRIAADLRGKRPYYFDIWFPRIAFNLTSGLAEIVASGKSFSIEAHPNAARANETK